MERQNISTKLIHRVPIYTNHTVTPYNYKPTYRPISHCW